jgi:ATPase family associated with various cellular activities (AAA)
MQRNGNRLTLDDLVGQQDALKLLRATEYGFVLIYGPMGCGKTTAALARAHELTGIWLTEDGVASAGYRTPDGKGHTVRRHIGQTLTKDDIRTWGTLEIWPVRVRIIDEAQEIPPRVLAHLKVLDYKSRERLIILCTTDPRTLDPAIVDRCVKVPLCPLGLDETKVLVERICAGRGMLFCDPRISESINKAEITRPRQIITVLDDVARGLTLEKAILNARGLI